MAIIGHILTGSFLDGLSVQIYQEHEISVGSYCVVREGINKFFCLLTNISWESSEATKLIPENFDLKSQFAKIYFQKKTKKIGKLIVQILLKNGQIIPVRHLPSLQSSVQIAENSDFNEIFGTEDLDNLNPKLFLGSPPASNCQITIELQKFIERSNGIFGKTGSGKTFLTRIMLAGLLRSQVASLLIFDIHGEYGLSARSEGNEQFVLGLKTLFPEKVVIFSLDPQATKGRGCSPDVEITIDLSEIDVEDIITMQSELNLHPTAIEVAALLFMRYGNNWLIKLLVEEIDLKDLASSLGAHLESLSALYRKLKRLLHLPFITKNYSSSNKHRQDIASNITNYLDKKISIILEFGRQTSKLAYLLVSGILTRQIHKNYVKKTEKFLSSQQAGDKPQPLIIVVEEAHNFLNPALAKQTIFGTIAREMRKYFVSLLVIDQRPSGICDEIVSQLGTKIVARLDDEKDLSTVFSGVANPQQLRSLISCLATSGQALIFGHGITLPMLLQIRRYDEIFYNEIKKKEKSDPKKIIDDLYF